MNSTYFFKSVFIFFLAGLLPLFSLAQIQGFTTENGLPSNGIKGIQWDEKTGFLWLATEAGIVRFNGTDFHTYTKENTPEIASERIMFITRNNAGSIYMTDLVGNIFSINKSKPLLWEKTSSITNPYFDNYFLLAVSDLFFKSRNTYEQTSKFSIATDKIVCINDSSCLILNSGTVYRLSLKSKTPEQFNFKNDKFISLFKIRNNYFVVNKNGGFFLLDVAMQKIIPLQMLNPENNLPFSGTNKPKLFWETGMPNPIFIFNNNAYVIDYNQQQLTYRIIATGIPSDAYIRSVQYSEKNKTLFIATDSKGLLVIKQNAVQSKKRESGTQVNRNSYYAQIELPNGNILTNEGDIIGENIVSVKDLPVKGKFDYAVSWTADSTLWYTQYEPKLGFNCLHRYNARLKQTIVYKKINTANVVTDLGANFYMANNLGIAILDGDSLRYLFKYSELGNIVFQIEKIGNQQLAVATCKGLFRFNLKNNQLDTIFSKDNICVRNIWQYNNYLFFGTYGGGFYMMKNNMVKQLPLDKKKYLLYTHCIVPDDHGFCWISTNRGLFKAKLEELIYAYEQDIPSVYYHYFGKKDGMEMTELNGGCNPCALAMKNKTISFPTMDGLLWVKPEEANPIMPDGEIYIDEILVDNKKINADSFTNFKLPALTKEISFLLGFTTWCNKENIYLEYQLNEDLVWKPVSIENEAIIRLSNLPAGKYVLKIRKLNGFGLQNYVYKEIRFTIQTAWYKEWWFYFLCFLFVLGITALIFRIRTRQYKIRQKKLEQQVEEKTKELLEKNEVLEKNNSIKTRLISIISHDIVTPLKFLTVAGKNLMEKKKMMSEDLQEETISEITNTAQELQLLSTNILNWIKYQNENRRMTKELFNVFDLVQQVNGILKSLAKQKQIQISNAVDKELMLNQFFEPLKILIYNLVTNAINFSEKGIVQIKNEIENEHIVIVVQDEGTGMSAAQIANIMGDQFIISSTNIDNKKGNGLGYLIIKDLIKMLNGSMKIISEKGKGTTVKIYLDK